MALFIAAAASAWAVAGTKCDLIAKHCFFDDTASSQSINCVLQGDSDANGPRLDHVIAQTMELSPNHEACPKINLSPGKKIFFHLLPCEGMLNHGAMFGQNGDLSSYAKTLPTEPCNQSTFTIGHALFDDTDTVLFSGGIAVQSTVEPLNDHKTSDRPMILRRPGSFGTDGSCNVINNGMSYVSISGVELNNENCVDAEIPASELDGALQKYGPDTMSLVRNSNIFESMANIQPENFHLFDVTLRTSQRYRSAYPGRALVSMDNVRSTVWPPVPVRLDGGYFRNLLDLHNMPRGGPLFVSPFYNDSNGTLVLNETKLEEDRISSRPLDMVLWDFQGKITFGRFPEDRKFTVVVFADRDISDIDFAEDEVVLDYNITAPSPQGLTLLDASDFYGNFFSDFTI